MSQLLDQLPTNLASWLSEHGARRWVSEKVKWPGIPGDRRYVLATVDFQTLSFTDHTFNPRTPSFSKVKELLASVRQLSLLAPLTCAFIRGRMPEPVVLIDGRHRFSALQMLANEEPGWAESARVDLKIYFGLNPGDLHILATYLNRNRRPLKKGEYYRAIVRIFEEKKTEIESEGGKPASEIEVFNSVNTQELPNRDFDLSIGRIVGLTAFDEEEADSWYPFVGTHQHQKFALNEETYYCPMTAGNLAEFLRSLCLSKPYDFGSGRAVEIGNVLKLGEIFRNTVFTRPVKRREEVTHTTVASKFWCLAALGTLMADFEEMPEGSSKRSVLAHPTQDWGRIEQFLEKYARIMTEQATIVERYKGNPDPVVLREAWSYQTQREQVRLPLKGEFERTGFRFRE